MTGGPSPGGERTPEASEAVRRLLHGEPDPASLAAWGVPGPWPPPGPYAVAVLWSPISVTPEHTWELAESAAAALGVPMYGPIPERLGVVDRDVAGVLVVPRCDDYDGFLAALQQVVDRRKLAAVYDVASGIESVREAYWYVEQVFGVATTVRHLLGPVMPVDDLLTFLAFARLDLAATFRFVDTWLGCCLADDAADNMIETAIAVLGAGRWKVNALAKHLKRRESTTHDRLIKFGKLTGIDFFKSSGYVPVPFELRVALFLYEWRAEELPPPGDPRWGHRPRPSGAGAVARLSERFSPPDG